MTINQNILPFYTSLDQQHYRFKWYANGQRYCVISPLNFIPPFQIIRNNNIGSALTVSLYSFASGAFTDISSNFMLSGYVLDQSESYDVLSFSSTLPIGTNYERGEYYLKIEDGTNTWYSEVFAMHGKHSDFVQIDFWHLTDFEFDQVDGNAQLIKYTAPYKGRAFFNTTIAKPRYPFFREVETRQGRTFDKVHISSKEFVFEVIVTEEILDALRLIPLHDRKEVKYKGRTYNVDELLISPTWTEQGDLAVCEVTFKTNTIAVTAGRSVTSTIYEPSAGTCLTVTHNCVGLIIDGSDNYTNYQYTDGDGNTQSLQNGDKVIVQTNSTLRVYQYNASTYTIQTTNAGDNVFNNTNGLYYVGTGVNIIVEPKINFYDWGGGWIAAPRLNGALHYIYAIEGSTETLIATYEYGDTMQATIPTSTEYLRMVITSGACGIFQTPDDYELTTPTGSGIGSMVIEGDNIVG